MKSNTEEYFSCLQMLAIKNKANVNIQKINKRENTNRGR